MDSRRPTGRSRPAAVGGPQGVRVIDLGRPLTVGMPQSPNHPGVLARAATPARRHGPGRRRLRRQRHDLDGHPRRHPHRRAGPRVPGRQAATAGSTRRGRLEGGRYVELGAHTIAPMVRRGVLLDVPAGSASTRLEPGYEITVATSRRRGAAGHRVGAGDVVLIRSGWGQHFDAGDKDASSGTTPAYPGSARPAPPGWPTAGSTPPAPTRSPSSASHRARGTRCCPPTGCCWSSTASTSSRRWTWSSWPERRSTSSCSSCPRCRSSAPPAHRSARWRWSGDERDRPLAEQLGRFAAARPRPTACPTRCVDSVRQRVLDILGLARRGAPLDTSRGASSVTCSTRAGDAQADRRRRLPSRLPAAQAALRQRRPGPLAGLRRHPPALGAAPQRQRRAGRAGRGRARRRHRRALVRAIAVGLEVAVRLGMAGYDDELGNSIFFEHGQHATSICGAMGSAVAAALLYGADEDGVAATPSGVDRVHGRPGIIEANRTGGTVKRLHCGWAAHAGVTAAAAGRGAASPARPRSSRGGSGSSRRGCTASSTATRSPTGSATTWSRAGHLLQAVPGQPLHACRRSTPAPALRERGITPERRGSADARRPAPQ